MHAATLPADMAGLPPQGAPTPPMPTRESGDAQSFSWLPRMPMRSCMPPPVTLKPSLLQYGCSFTLDIRSDHGWRPNVVGAYVPLENSSNSDVFDFAISRKRVLPSRPSYM